MIQKFIEDEDIEKVFNGVTPALPPDIKLILKEISALMLKGFIS